MVVETVYFEPMEEGVVLSPQPIARGYGVVTSQLVQSGMELIHYKSTSILSSVCVYLCVCACMHAHMHVGHTHSVDPDVI